MSDEQPGAQTIQFASGGGAVDDTSDEALQVGQTVQQRADTLPWTSVAIERVHGVQALLQCGAVA
jgi:hypothetical protein